MYKLTLTETEFVQFKLTETEYKQSQVLSNICFIIGYQCSVCLGKQWQILLWTSLTVENANLSKFNFVKVKFDQQVNCENAYPFRI